MLEPYFVPSLNNFQNPIPNHTIPYQIKPYQTKPYQTVPNHTKLIIMRSFKYFEKFQYWGNA